KGCVVGRARHAGRDPRAAHLLRELGRAPGRQLRGVTSGRRRTPLALLLAAHHHPGVALLAGALDPRLPDPLPRDVLLLPEGVLPVVLSRPAGVRGRRAAWSRLPR